MHERFRRDMTWSKAQAWTARRKSACRHMLAEPVPRRFLFEAMLAAGVILLAALFATTYLVLWCDIPQGEYRFWADGATGLAVEGRLSAPDPARSPDIEAFLNKECGSVDLDAVRRNSAFTELGNIQRVHIYLSWAAALCWRLLGLHWNALLPLYGLLFGAAAGCAYGLFRLAMNRTLSLLGTLLFCLNPSHLAVLPDLRDYAKAPFILACLLILGLLLKEKKTPKAVLGWAAALGALIGFGLGFRQDVQVCLVAAGAVLLFFLPAQRRKDIVLRLKAVGVMAACFLITAFPILAAMHAGGACPAHNMLQGMGPPCTSQMRLAEVDYQLVPQFNDFLIDATVRSHARESLGAETPVPYLSRPYNKAGLNLMFRYARCFPADVLQRACASVRVVTAKTPFLWDEPGYRTNAFLDRIAPGLLRIYWPLRRILPAVVVLVLALVLFRSVRLGLGLIFLYLFFSAYPALQFHFRHFFHLGFLYWWFFGVLVYWLVRQIVNLAMPRRRRIYLARCRWSRKSIIRAACKAAVAGTLLILAAAGLHFWTVRMQTQGYQALAASLESASSRSLSFTMEEQGKDVLLCPEGLFPAEYSPEDLEWQLRSAGLVAQFRTADTAIPVRLVYEAGERRSDFSVSMLLPTGGENTTVRAFAPIYESPPGANVGMSPAGQRTFRGLLVPAEYAPYFKGFHATSSAGLGLPIFLAAADDWATRSIPRPTRYDPPPKSALHEALLTYLNILPDGGLENWPEGASAPTACQPPRQASEILRETGQVSEGRFALRQRWTESDGALHPLLLYGLYGPAPKSHAPYVFSVDVNNPSDTVFRVGVWLVTAPKNATPQLTGLCGEGIPIGKTNGFQTFTTYFRVPAVPPDSYLLFTTAAHENFQPGVEVVWDRWRAAPVLAF